MKNSKNLFSKFKEKEILDKTNELLSFVGGARSSQTGDHDCSTVLGTPDCTDNQTSFIDDVHPTGRGAGDNC